MSLRKNFAYSGILTVSNYVFPLITFPYVSRVLGVTNIGICNFVDSIVNYYVLFSMMGVPLIGIREIAKNSNNRVELDKTFTSLFLLNAMMTCFALIVFIISIYSVSQLYQYRELLYYSVLKIVFNMFLIEWFYKGIENFRYITTRNILLKFVYVVAIFFFVRTKDDYVAYYVISIFIVVLDALINWQYKKNFVTLNFKNVSLKQYIVPFFSNGVYFILTSVYLSFNITFLGFVSRKEEVGYYTTATKIYGIFLALFTAFTGVILPRMSSLVGSGDIRTMIRLAQKSFDLLYLICPPLIILIIMLSPEIIMIIGGNGFEGAIVPMRIITPLLLIVGMAQILVFQILAPLKKDKLLLYNSITGAFIGLIFNIFLVGHLKSIGSALTLVITEVIVLGLSVYFVKKQVGGVVIHLKELFRNLFYSIPYVIICFLCKTYFTYSLVVCSLASFFSFAYFVLIQVYILKNDEFLSLVKFSLSKRQMR